MPGNGVGQYREAGDPATVEDSVLLARWRRGDLTARDALVARYLPLATRIAYRYRRAHEPPDDLVQVASVGLLKALERYDPERASSVSTFAVPTILGELKRHFRDRGWAVRMPRDLQELALKVERATDEIARRLGRSPTVGEVAEELGITMEQVVEAQEAASAYRAVPLDAPRDDGEGGEREPGPTLGGDDPGYEAAEQRATLDRLMRVLPEREREVLRLRFVEDLTQTEIGARMGISQMHVSRLIRRALDRLREVAGER
jgi:RNA polymerase sigma-B factor